MVNHQLTKFIGGTALGMSRLWAQPTDSLTYAFVLLLCSSLDFSNCLSFSCGLLARMPPTIPVIIALLECLLLTEWLHRLVKWPELYEFSLKSLGPHNSWKNVKEEKKKRSLVMGKGQSQVSLQQQISCCLQCLWHWALTTSPSILREQLWTCHEMRTEPGKLWQPIVHLCIKRLLLELYVILLYKTFPLDGVPTRWGLPGCLGCIWVEVCGRCTVKKRNKARKHKQTTHTHTKNQWPIQDNTQTCKWLWVGFQNTDSV